MKTKKPRLLLASASARRRRILADLGLAFAVVSPRVREVLYTDDPARTARENALRKNAWCRRRHPGAAIIAADTVLDFRGRCVIKPHSMRDAAAMLRMLSGKRHDVLTAVAFSQPGSSVLVRLARSAVFFRRLSGKAIRMYLAKVNPLDKAGAYDIDQEGALIIRRHTGSRTNIMGLPRGTVTAWLARVE